MKLRLLPVVAIAAARKPRASAGVRRTPTRDRPLLFFHLPKTGGSSLRHVILQTFPRAVSLVPGSGGLPFEATERDLANDQWRDRAACTTVAAGHFKPGPLLKTLVRQRWLSTAPDSSKACHVFQCSVRQCSAIASSLR